MVPVLKPKRRRNMLKTIPALFLIAALTISGSAQASLVTFTFNGICNDCMTADPDFDGLIWAELVLMDYQEGSKLKEKNFHSFTYSGSNLVGGLDAGGNVIANSAITFDRSDVKSAKKLVLSAVEFDGQAIESLNLRLIRANEPLWGCTPAGEAVAQSGPACGHTESVVFKVGNGAFQFGAPAKDHGSAVSPSHLVAEPRTFALFALALISLGMVRQSMTRTAKRLF